MIDTILCCVRGAIFRGLGTWAAASMMMLAGCQAPQSPATARAAGPGELPVWPSPPEKPRIAFQYCLEGPIDLGARVSFWQRVGNMLTGTALGREPWRRPLGLAVDSQGNLYIADPGDSAVGFYDKKKHRYQRLNRIGTNNLVSPVSVVGDGQTLYVADTGLNLVIACTTAGKPLFCLDRKSGFGRPAGLALSRERLYIADAEKHQILIFDLAGNLLSQFGQAGEGPGEMNRPTHLAVDGQGLIYVTDSLNARIQVFNPAGKFSGIIGGPGDSSGHFGRPKGLAVDQAGDVFVVDAMYDNIQIFDQGGAFLLDVGHRGTGPGEFWLPSGLAIDAENMIYIADSYNQRIQVLRLINPKNERDAK